MAEHKIEVRFDSDHDDIVHYHYVIFEWCPPEGDKKGKGFWFNSGMNGFADTPEEAFAEGMKQYRKYVQK